MSDSIGPQKGPSSSAKINAEQKQAIAMLNELESLWVIEIARDEKREFIYSEIGECAASQFSFIKYRFDNEPNCIVFVDVPEDGRIFVVTQDKSILSAFYLGLYFEQSKYEYWEKMFSIYIDSKTNK